LKPVVSLALLALSCVVPYAHAEPEASDPKAVALAARVMDALGGEAAWNALPGLRWTFASTVRDTTRSPRRHAWNKHTGWHRVEGADRAGDRYVVIHNVNTGEGRAWVAGNAIEGDSLAKLVERGKALWINDTYWMLMPYKMRDPGVILSMEEPVTRDGRLCDRVAMRFEQVGRTPGDRYWVDIDRATHRVCGWDMVLEGDAPPPRSFTWEDWEVHDGLWFPTSHVRGETNIRTFEIETVRAFGAAEFTAP
jgi:hypothetical protein